jgi:hypothetical protein
VLDLAEALEKDAQNATLTAQLECGDLDGDGEVAGPDLGLMLLNYGPCAQ